MHTYFNYVTCSVRVTSKAARLVIANPVHGAQIAVCGLHPLVTIIMKLESATSPAADYKFPFPYSNAATGISKHAPKLMGRPFWRHAAVAALIYIFTSDQALHGKGVIVLPCHGRPSSLAWLSIVEHIGTGPDELMCGAVSKVTITVPWSCSSSMKT